MTTNVYVVEYIDGVPVTIHITNKPNSPTEDGFYRETVSANAFRNFWTNDNTRKYRKGIIPHRKFRVRWEDEYLNDLKWECEDYTNVPLKAHFGVFNFYKAVGYDYKKKRFV